MPTKVTYIISNIDKALAFEWVASNLNTKQFILSFILLNPSQSSLQSFLEERQIPVKFIKYRGKKDLIPALFKCWVHLVTSKTQIVHTHLFEANIVGLIAAKLAGIKTRIHTRHHSTWHHDYFPSAIKYDKFINRLSTKIIAISKNVNNVLVYKESVNASKIRLIHHGFDLDLFDTIDEEEVKNLRQKHLSSNTAYPIIGVIARQTEWKGIQYIIPAFKNILKQYPSSKLILANAKGDYKTHISNLLATIPQDSFVEIEFEKNLSALYHLFDIYVHVPINSHCEAFGQTYIESLASQIPSIFTISGIASEFITHNYNALVVDYANSDDIESSILQILKNPSLKKKLIQRGRESVRQFSLPNFIEALETVYSETTKDQI